MKVGISQLLHEEKNSGATKGKVMVFLHVCIKVDLYQDVKVAVFQLIVYQIVNKCGHHIC